MVRHSGDGITFHYQPRVATEVALVMCSSASVERVFSLLNNLFDDFQHRCLNDYKEASIKIRYNENYRDRKQYQ